MLLQLFQSDSATQALLGTLDTSFRFTFSKWKGRLLKVTDIPKCIDGWKFALCITNTVSVFLALCLYIIHNYNRSLRVVLLIIVLVKVLSHHIYNCYYNLMVLMLLTSYLMVYILRVFKHHLMFSGQLQFQKMTFIHQVRYHVY